MQFWRSYKRAWRSINEIEFYNGHVERIDRRQWNKYRSIAYKYFDTPMQFFRLFRDFRTSSRLFPSSLLLGYQCFHVFSCSPLSVSLASSSFLFSLFHSLRHPPHLPSSPSGFDWIFSQGRNVSTKWIRRNIAFRQARSNFSFNKRELSFSQTFHFFLHAFFVTFTVARGCKDNPRAPFDFRFPSIISSSYIFFIFLILFSNDSIYTFEKYLWYMI